MFLHNFKTYLYKKRSSIGLKLRKKHFKKLISKFNITAMLMNFLKKDKEKKCIKDV